MTHGKRALLLRALAMTSLTRGGISAAAFASSRISALQAEIGHHDEVYFRKCMAGISDAHYDRLVSELDDLERQFPTLALGHERPDPFGDDRTGGRRFSHRVPMLSLDKCHSEPGLRAFYARMARVCGRPDVACVVEPKFDGVAISAVYERGGLVRVVSRGNGLEGDDVTANALATGAIPERLTGADQPAHALIPDLIEMRGEIFLPLKEFKRINR
ncbi:MAG: ligase LigA, partial [Verrucomicrobia bacterium]|nr:ligase LigA [Verrucomicrobiota bacterium]